MFVKHFLNVILALAPSQQGASYLNIEDMFGFEMAADIVFKNGV